MNHFLAFHEDKPDERKCEESVGKKRELYEPEGHGSSQEALGGFTFLQCVCQLAWLEVWEGERETYP